MSDFNDYQRAARKTAIYPAHLKGIYPVLGLCGEAGEVAEKVKKLHRDGTGLYCNVWREALQKELGDVLWYLAAIAGDYEISLDSIASESLKKLQDRQNRGVLGGSGDNR